MNWHIKVLGQRILSKITAGPKIYHALQRKIGGLQRPSYVVNRVFQAIELIKALKVAGVHIDGKSTMEIGTGWIPVIPMVFYILGQSRCYSFDIECLLENELTLKAGHKLISLFENTRLIEELEVPERLEVFREVDNIPELFYRTNINYHAPADARQTFLKSGSIDIIFSNTTLEHIPPRQISELFCEAHRLLAPGGMMVHLIDCSDHFSHSDNNICNLNFLRFSTTEWGKYNSKFLYQNRLRVNHYRDLVNEANFEILYWDTRDNQTILSDSISLSFAREFENLSLEDISAIRVIMVARQK